MIANTPLLTACGITKFYGRRLGCIEVSFDLYEGEVLAVVGESGSGKSTLLGLLSAGIEGVTRSRPVDGGLELHVKGSDRLIPRIVLAAERGGFDLSDVSVAEPSLETVFISLTGKELRD